MCCISNSRELTCLPWGVVKRSKLFLYKSCHVEYQIKGKEVYNNVQANILPLHTPMTLGWGQKVKTFFSKSCHFAYKIKANEMYRGDTNLMNLPS